MQKNNKHFTKLPMKGSGRPHSGQGPRDQAAAGESGAEAGRREHGRKNSPARPQAGARQERAHSNFVQDADQSANSENRPPSAEAGPVFLPGLKPVLELLQTSPEKIDCVYVRKGRRDKASDAVLDLCRERGVRFSLLEEKPFARLYAGGSQGVLARLFEAGYVELEELLESAARAPLPLLLALDQVLDPGNAGTLARTLYALGGAGLFLPRHQGAFLGAGAARAAAGALQKLPVAKVTNLAAALDQAAEAGFRIYGGAAGRGAESIYEFKPEFPAVLVLGGEEAGLRPGIAKRCDTLLEVPMRRDFDSLNVAQAGAILLGFLSAARQR